MADEILIGEGVIPTKVEPYIDQADFDRIARITEQDLQKQLGRAQKSLEKLWSQGSPKAKLFAQDLKDISNRIEAITAKDVEALKGVITRGLFPDDKTGQGKAFVDSFFDGVDANFLQALQGEGLSDTYAELIKLSDGIDRAAGGGKKATQSLSALERLGLRGIAQVAPGSAEGLYAVGNALNGVSGFAGGAAVTVAGVVGVIAGLNVAAYKLATGGLSQANEELKQMAFSLELATGSGELSQTLEEIRQRANLSSIEMATLAFQTSNTAQSLGLTREQASQYTDELVSLAEIMSVLGNVPLATALDDVQAIMNGSVDTAAKYGLNVSELSSAFQRLPDDLSATESQMAGLAIVQDALAGSSGLVAERQEAMGTTIADLQMQLSELRSEMVEASGPATDSLKDSFSRLFEEIATGVNGGVLDDMFDKLGQVGRSSVELGRQFLDLVGIIERNPVTVQIDFAQVGGYDINADPAATLTAGITGAVNDMRGQFNQVNMDFDTIYGPMSAQLGDVAGAVDQIVTGVEAEVARLGLTAEDFRTVMMDLKTTVDPEVYAALHPELWAIYTAMVNDEKAARDAAGGMTELANATSLTREEALALQGVQLDQANAGYQLVDQVFALAEAQAALEESNDPQAVLDYSQAYNRLQKTMTEYEGSLDTLTDSLQDQYEAGVITAEQYFMMLQVISATAGVAGGAQQGIYNVISAERQLSSQSLITASDLSLVVGLLNAVAGAVRTSINNLAIGSQAMYEYSRTAAEAFRAIDRMESGQGGSVANIANITGRLQGLASQISGFGGMGDIIGDFGRKFGGAMDDVKKGAGGAADAVEELEEELSDLEKALEAVGQIQTLVGGIIGVKDAQKNIKGIKSDIKDLKEYQKELPGLIKDYTKELEDAKKAAEAITASEAVRIEQAEENYKAMELAYQQGFASANELALAEEQLAQAKADAVDVENDPTVQQAQDNLNQAKEDQLYITQAIIEAEEELMMAQLDLIEAQLQLGAAMEEMGDIATDIFRNIAYEVGLTSDEVDKLIKTAEAASRYAADAEAALGRVYGGDDTFYEIGDTEPGSGGSSSSSGGTYTVKSGDTLSGIASKLNYPGGWQALYDKNKSVIGGDPNLIKVGQILKLAKGGDLLPGQIAMVGEEGIPEFITVRQPTTVSPMQDFVEAMKNSGGFGGVRDVNIYLQPRWPIDRAEARKIALKINEEIRQINRMAQM